MRTTFAAALLCGAITLGGLGDAKAGPLTASASLYSPVPVAGSATPIALAGLATPSQSQIATPDYTISFIGVPADQGLVQGQLDGRHAVPVAGVIGGAPEYLTGDYGSALTTDRAASGNYLSTDTKSIEIDFTHDQRALALLWGSIDTTNSVTLLEDGVLVGSITGADVQSLASGFVSNGFQGPGGSAYVTLNSADPFDQVRFSSGVVSFELGGVVASTTAIPEPASLALLGLGVTAMGAVRRRRA